MFVEVMTLTLSGYLVFDRLLFPFEGPFIWFDCLETSLLVMTIFVGVGLLLLLVYVSICKLRKL